MLKSPKFWQQKNFLSSFFLPLSYIFHLSYLIYFKIKREIKINTPVLCVGNIVIGGSGKTPIAIKLRKILSKKFSNIFVLTRGYKGLKKGPLIIKKKSTFTEVGDEGILHSHFGTTCMSKNKTLGAVFCEKNKSDLIIMDDGLQSRNVKKQVSLLVVDSEYALGNERIFPAGPLRQSINFSLKLSDAVIIVDNSNNYLKHKVLKDKKIFFAKKIIKIRNLNNHKIFAFCGLGNNKNFLNGLKKLNYDVKKFKGFPDHHIYKTNEIKKIINYAKLNKLSIVCTQKDYLKIPDKFKKDIYVADLDIQIINEKKFFDFLVKKLNSKKN